MKRWLRFEDSYGMCDIYCAYHMLEYRGTDSTVYGEDKLQPATSSPGCFFLNRNTVMAYQKAGYDECVIFFDMDPISGEETILSPDWISKHVQANPLVTYAPVIWCA